MTHHRNTNNTSCILKPDLLSAWSPAQHSTPLLLNKEKILNKQQFKVEVVLHAIVWTHSLRSFFILVILRFLSTA